MTWGDLFAGGGGTTTGALSVKGVRVLWALNHSKEAIYTHKINHPETEHYRADIRDMDEHKLCEIDGLWASLECTNFSNAKGGRPKNEDSRTLAWELIRYIIHCKPFYIVIENVREFMAWGPVDENGKPLSKDKGKEYLKWVNYIKKLGYEYDYRILNSADFGSYTSRRRYFGVFAAKGYKIEFPEPLFKKSEWKKCKEKINLSETGKSIFGRKKPLAEKTLQRIAAGIKKFYPETAHIMQYYGSGYNGQSLEKPLNTVTTKDRHALINFLCEKEKKHFISDHIWGSQNQSIEKPLNTICTKESKQLITVDKHENIHKEEKYQFITKFFGGSGNPNQYSSLDKPLGTILTNDKNALVTMIINYDFDVKLRFLTPKELADITGFPEDYKWYGSKKFITWMVGNAVPIELSKSIIHSIKSEYDIRRSKTKPGRDHVVTREVQEIPRSSDELFNSRGLFQKNQDLN